jgi:hypothetical protein
MYFLRRLRPLEVVGERVRSLRVSLNAPVLTTADLPVGPARALVVVHQDARGRMDATVGARSVVSGEIAYWSFDGELLSNVDLSVAADAALTFAESLGFLFDEGSLSGAAADKAFRSWLEGEPGDALQLERRGGAAAGSAQSPARSPEPAELELEELVLEEEPAAQPRSEPAPPAAEAAPLARKSPQALSKFRARSTPAPAAPAAPQRKVPLRQPLARVQLVKRRSPEDERKLVLRRLITSF